MIREKELMHREVEEGKKEYGGQFQGLMGDVPSSDPHSASHKMLGPVLTDNRNAT